MTCSLLYRLIPKNLLPRQDARAKEIEPPTEIQIFPMQPRDLDEVLAIERKSFPTPWSRSAFLSELLENNRSCYLVARAGGREGKVVGYAGAWLVLDEAHVTNIAVHEAWRRRGIGEKLLCELIERTKARGARRMTLEVRVSNVAAQNLYRKLGFRDIGTRKGYYQDNNEDALIMWKERLD